MKTRLDNLTRKTIATKVITTFLSLILCQYIYGSFWKKTYISIFTKTFIIYLWHIDDTFFIWTGSKEQLLRNLGELNTKQVSIKFEYKISKTSISFLDKEVYIKNNKLYIKIYRKQTDRQCSLHTDSEHPKSSKDSIPYSHNTINWICATSKYFDYYCKELKQWFREQGYNSKLLDKHIKTVDKLDKSELIKGNKKDTPISTRIHLAIRYNRVLPNISKIIWKKLEHTIS